MLDSTESASLLQSGEPGLLGNIAEIVSTVSLSRVLRFYLQSLARELVPTHRPIRGKHKGELVPHKVTQCLRWIAPHKAAEGVDIMYSPARQKARYRNLIICGCLWVCPICAARITEERRAELSTALSAARGKYKFVLVTYTMSHHKGQALSLLVGGLLEAFRRLKQGRAWLDIKECFGWAGSVRALETTEGSEAFDNGWHPHIHELVLLPADIEETHGWWEPLLADQLRQRWQKVLRSQGFDCSLERGVTLETADERVLEYVAKFGREPKELGWTIERELTKGPSKISRLGGRTPLQLLWDYGRGDKEAGRLFQEYAAAFEGRNQLVWSPGLQALLGIKRSRSDEQAASAPLDPNEALLLNLAPQEWYEVVRLRLRGELEEYAGRVGGAADGADLVRRWLTEKGVPEFVRQNLTDLMWQEVDKLPLVGSSRRQDTG